MSELLIVAGLAAIVAGVALWSTPLAFVVGGAFCVLVGVGLLVEQERSE